MNKRSVFNTASIICGIYLITTCASAKLGSETTSEKRFLSVADSSEKPRHAGSKIRPPKEPVKKLTIPEIQGSESPQDDNIHDRKNTAISVLQDPAIAMKDFPRDRHQQVDWVKTLDQGRIDPRANVAGKGKMSIKNGDIIMKNTHYMPWVKFSHSAHTEWLACKNCHLEIFAPKRHANPITMNKVLRGEYCGVCHDKVAFSLFICERCHSLPHKDSGPKWW